MLDFFFQKCVDYWSECILELGGFNSILKYYVVFIGFSVFILDCLPQKPKHLYMKKICVTIQIQLWTYMLCEFTSPLFLNKYCLIKSTSISTLVFWSCMKYPFKNVNFCLVALFIVIADYQICKFKVICVPINIWKNFQNGAWRKIKYS